LKRGDATTSRTVDAIGKFREQTMVRTAARDPGSKAPWLSELRQIPPTTPCRPISSQRLTGN